MRRKAVDVEEALRRVGPRGLVDLHVEGLEARHADVDRVRRVGREVRPHGLRRRRRRHARVDLRAARA